MYILNLSQYTSNVNQKTEQTFSLRPVFADLEKVTDPQGTVTNAFVYDLAGNLVKEIDGNGYQMGETDEERAGILYRYNYAG